MLAFLGFSAKAAHLGPQILFTANATGAQEVPAVTTNAQASAYFYLNASQDTLCVRAAWFGLSGAPTGIHIHEAEMGQNGGVVFNLTDDIRGGQLVSRITGNDLNPSVIAKLLSGAYYLNIHTTANPNGEIRGQIMPEKDPGFYAVLNTAQETGMVTVDNATGLAVIKVSRDKRSLWIEQVADSLTETPGGAHIHYAAPGMDGPVILDLSSLIDGNRISGVVMVTPGLVDSLMSGNAYINVHTSSNPGGEIRGQINNLPVLGFDAVMDADQETGVVILTNGRGVAHFHLSNTFDTLHFYVQLSGLTGPVMGAHLHAADPGMDGNVVLDLTNYVNGNIITGIVVGANLTEQVIVGMVTGGLYLNVHTAMNMNGEVRGQVYRYLREGYVMELNGAQQTGMVSTSAAGIGFASVDRDQSNLYYSVTVNGLSGALNGAHFHQAARGADGNVVFDLTDNFMKMGTSDYAMGYIDLTSDPEKVAVRTNMLYLNIHTAANANGEIRGQLERKSPCADAPTQTSVSDSPENSRFAIYPNPSAGQVYVRLEPSSSLELNVVNLQGQVLGKFQVNDTDNVLDLTGFKAGVYFIQDAKSGQSLKVVLQ